MAEVVAGVLAGALPASQPFMEAGLDSLGAVDLRNALDARFAVSLPATATFDHPTTAAMAAFIAAELAPRAVRGHRLRNNVLCMSRCMPVLLRAVLITAP